MFPHSPSKTVMAIIQNDSKPKSPSGLTQVSVHHNFETQVEQLSKNFIQSLHNIRNETLEQARHQIDLQKQELELEKKEWEMEKEELLKMNPIEDEIIYLDVGGKLFTTSIQTLRNSYPISGMESELQGNFFTSMFSGRFSLSKTKDGRIFIDRDGQLFEYILEYLRNGEILLDDNLPEHQILKKKIIREAMFYRMEDLIIYLNGGEANDTNLVECNQQFKYVSDFDENGLFFWIGKKYSQRNKKNSWSNPFEVGLVNIITDANYYSVPIRGDLNSNNLAFIFERNNSSSTIASAVGSSFVIDLKTFEFQLERLTISCNYMPTHWFREITVGGSNDGITWKYARLRKVSSTLSDSPSTDSQPIKNWIIEPTDSPFSYRYFNIRSLSQSQTLLSCIEFYGKITTLLN